MRVRKAVFASFVTLSVLGLLPMLYSPTSPVASTTPYLSPMADMGVDMAWATCSDSHCKKIFHGPWICFAEDGVDCVTDGVTCTNTLCN